MQIKLPVGTLSSSDALLRTDSLSGTDPALSDGSVGSAPSLGLSPGPPCSTESTRSQDKSKQKSQMISEGVDEEGLDERVKVLPMRTECFNLGLGDKSIILIKFWGCEIYIFGKSGIFFVRFNSSE